MNMRTALAVLVVLAALVIAPAAMGNDRREVRWTLQDIGASRIHRIVCDEQRHCTARYAYVDKAALRAGLRLVAVNRCRSEFSVADGVDNLGDGYVFEYTEVTQYNERCGHDWARYSRDGVKGRAGQARH